MPEGRARHELEILPSDDGAVVAYADEALDGAERLRVDIRSGAVTAFLGQGRLAHCGYVSERTASELARLDSVIWARFSDTNRRTVSLRELPLEMA
jgi:hypothetical protein